MKKKQDAPAATAGQRKPTKAKRAVGTVRAATASAADVLSPAAAQKLLHELQVHQVQLQMQNEELRRAQVKLDAARARYFDLYDLAPMGYLTLNERGLIVEANLTAAVLLGIVKSTLANRPLAQFVSREDQDSWYQYRKRLVETRAPQNCELRMLRAGGAPLWVRVEATAVPSFSPGSPADTDGAPVYRLVLINITEDKNAEETLRENDLRYRMVLKTAMDGFWVVDLHGRLLEVNEAYCRMSGYSAPELLTMCISDLEAGETPADTATHFRKVKVYGEDRFESRHRRKDGTVFDIEISVQLRPLKGGRCVAFLRDITERKRAEEALRASEARLRRLAVELARVEERERQRLAVCLHDEIAQTLAVLRMKLGALTETLGASPVQADITQIRDLLGMTIDQTRSLVFDLSPPVLHQLGLAAAVEWAGEKIRRDHNLIFVFHGDSERSPLDAERQTLLFRCARELMMNTAKHARATRLTATVKRSRGDVCVTVEDDGCGFDVTRLDRWPQDVGFGLFSVRERMAATGGRCEIVSTPGRRTRVTLTLPISPRKDEP